MQVALIAAITLLATISVVLGLDKGIKRLSVTNIWIAATLLVFVLLIGPTLFVLNGFVEHLGIYLNDFPALAFWNETYTQGSWQNGWTVFYWGWWIAWAPFVGMFIARISKGRTIREFLGDGYRDLENYVREQPDKATHGITGESVVKDNSVLLAPRAGIPRASSSSWVRSPRSSRSTTSEIGNKPSVTLTVQK